MKKEEKDIIILLFISLALTLFMSYLFKDAIAKISKDYIELLIGLSITLAGFGLVAFQIGKASNELKKDFIESSILMIISSLCGIAFWIYPEYAFFGIIASFLFLWGIFLLLVILINERFGIISVLPTDICRKLE